MGLRGRKVRPEFQRYESAGRSCGVYVVEIGDMLKVGRSGSPAKRLRQLHTEHAYEGQSLGRFCVFPVAGHPVETSKAERSAIRALTRAAQVIPGHIEYFSGISFDAATAVVSNALQAA